MKPLSLETSKGSCKICREPFELSCSLNASVTSMAVCAGTQVIAKADAEVERPQCHLMKLMIILSSVDLEKIRARTGLSTRDFPGAPPQLYVAFPIQVRRHITHLPRCPVSTLLA